MCHRSMPCTKFFLFLCPSLSLSFSLSFCFSIYLLIHFPLFVLNLNLLCHYHSPWYFANVAAVLPPCQYSTATATICPLLPRSVPTPFLPIVMLNVASLPQIQNLFKTLEYQFISTLHLIMRRSSAEKNERTRLIFLLISSFEAHYCWWMRDIPCSIIFV